MIKPNAPVNLTNAFSVVNVIQHASAAVKTKQNNKSKFFIS